MPDRHHGILNLAKPLGMTSHDVVARVRRIAAQKSVGHAGTLDPLATGVLVVLLGRATALSGYAMAGEKIYEAVVALGTATTTDDAEGEVCRRAEVPDLDRTEVEAVLATFVGETQQVPPRFSAVKVAGKTAYAEARKGRDVELAPRTVTIHSIELLELQPAEGRRWLSDRSGSRGIAFSTGPSAGSQGRAGESVNGEPSSPPAGDAIRALEPPSLRLRVRCGPGTYIRSLARDIGEALGSAAHLASLVRVASGRFHLEDAVALESLTSASLSRSLLPSDTVVEHLPRITLTAAEAARARHGAEVAGGLDHVEKGNAPARERPQAPLENAAVRLYSPEGTFLALARAAGSNWRPFRVLDPSP